MTENGNLIPYQLADNEKVASVMAYNPLSIYWGEVVVKDQIRVSTWLRTTAAPDSICLYNAKALIINTGETPKPMTFTELHIPTGQILAFHLIPPAKDPIDYDLDEPNRQMIPITILFGTFRVDGNIRLSTRSSLSKYMEISRETYTSIYDAEISNPVMSSLGVIRVPFLLVRQTTAIYAK